MTFCTTPRGNIEESVDALKEMRNALSDAIEQGDTQWQETPIEEPDRTLPEGGYAFIVAFALCGLLTGAFVGLLLSEFSVTRVAISYAFVATGFSTAIYILVRLGFFPIADELFAPESDHS